MAITFCGASVRGFSSNLGWNEQQGTFRVSVVEDLDNGDFFNPPPTGTPIYFQYGAFYFFGLLQRWVRSNGVDGLPVFDIDCVDPRQLLDGAQIITGSYRGAITVNNLFNVFGWWENLTGFGSSLSNDAGMPYYKVIEALSVMSNSLVGLYGTAILYKGVRYTLDFSEIPFPPAYYRVPSPNISLMELISMVCEDAGCDYFVELELYTIKIRTVSRALAAPLGAIGVIQGAGYGVDLIRSSAGVENRNEITSAFVIGGERQDLFLNGGNDIQPFWGFDIDGNPIMGAGVGLAHAADLNASEVADILGDITYNCTVYEMCCALGGMESWMSFMQQFKPSVVSSVGIPGLFGAPFGNPCFPTDKMNQDALAVGFANQAAAGNINHFNAQRMYQFVLTYASDYMGKKFLVAIPFTSTAAEPETSRVIYSQVPTDGGYLPEGSEPLGLPVLVSDQFKTQDGRFQAFCLFNNLTNVDLSRLSGGGNDIYAGENGIYMQCSVDGGVVFTPAPAVIVTLSNPIYENPNDTYGDVTFAAEVLGTGPADIAKMAENIAGGHIDFRIRPQAHQPDFIAVPLRSNVLTYGPWSAQGAPGKVRFETDSSLVPWQFGGYELMNLAGSAKVTQSITYMQDVETGSLEFVGPPQFSLGDLLQGNGPNITAIDVSYGERGITTIYRMSTFTPKIGTNNFNKDSAKRMERLGRLSTEMRKNLRAAINRSIDTEIVINNAYQGWLNNLPARMKRESPHTTLISITKDDPNNPGCTRTSIATATVGEIVTGCGAQNSDVWKRTGIMGLTGILRAFSTNSSASGIAKYNTSPPAEFTTTCINKDVYDPLQNTHDMNQLAWGTTFQSMNPQAVSDAGQEKRGLALRGPLLVSGWGWTIDGKKVPGDDTGAPGVSYATNTLKKSHLWKTGPVDLLWDDKRGVWTSHDILIGKAKTAMVANGNGTLEVWNGSAYTGYDMPISNWFSGTIDAASKIVCGYCVTANKWYVIAADCAT